MFTDIQLTAALSAYGTSASTHAFRLSVLADMRETDNATIEDIAIAIRHAAACDELGVTYRDWETDRKSTRLNSSHSAKSRMPSSA